MGGKRAKFEKGGGRGGGEGNLKSLPSYQLLLFPEFPIVPVMMYRRLSFERALVQFLHYITWNRFAAVICT